MASTHFNPCESLLLGYSCLLCATWLDAFVVCCCSGFLVTWQIKILWINLALRVIFHDITPAPIVLKSVCTISGGVTRCMQKTPQRFVKQHPLSEFSGRRCNIKQASTVSLRGCLPSEDISWLAEQQQQQQRRVQIQIQSPRPRFITVFSPYLKPKVK